MSDPLEGFDFEAELDLRLEVMRRTMLAKNRDYGNSALSPSRTVPGLPPSTAILVRMGDKVARIDQLRCNPGEVKEEGLRDTTMDLACYTLLLDMAQMLEGGEK